jgi:hypothetical protein
MRGRASWVEQHLGRFKCVRAQYSSALLDLSTAQAMPQSKVDIPRVRKPAVGEDLSSIDASAPLPMPWEHVQNATRRLGSRLTRAVVNTTQGSEHGGGPNGDIFELSASVLHSAPDPTCDSFAVPFFRPVTPPRGAGNRWDSPIQNGGNAQRGQHRPFTTPPHVTEAVAPRVSDTRRAVQLERDSRTSIPLEHPVLQALAAGCSIGLHERARIARYAEKSTLKSHCDAEAHRRVARKRRQLISAFFARWVAILPDKGARMPSRPSDDLGDARNPPVGRWLKRLRPCVENGSADKSGATMQKPPLREDEACAANEERASAAEAGAAKAARAARTATAAAERSG